MMERASAGETRALSKASRSSGRDRKPWPRPRWISSSTWVMVSSSARTRDAAVAVLAMRYLPSWAHNRHALVTAPPPAQARFSFAGTLGGLGSEHLGHYLVTHEAAKCSRHVSVCLLTGDITTWCRTP